MNDVVIRHVRAGPDSTHRDTYTWDMISSSQPSIHISDLCFCHMSASSFTYITTIIPIPYHQRNTLPIAAYSQISSTFLRPRHDYRVHDQTYRYRSLVEMIFILHTLVHRGFAVVVGKEKSNSQVIQCDTWRTHDVKQKSLNWGTRASDIAAHLPRPLAVTLWSYTFWIEIYIGIPAGVIRKKQSALNRMSSKSVGNNTVLLTYRLQRLNASNTIHRYFLSIARAVRSDVCTATTMCCLSNLSLDSPSFIDTKPDFLVFTIIRGGGESLHVYIRFKITTYHSIG